MDQILHGQPQSAKEIRSRPIQRLAHSLANGLRGLNADDVEPGFCKMQTRRLSSQTAADNGYIGNGRGSLVGHQLIVCQGAEHWTGNAGFPPETTWRERIISGLGASIVGNN